MAGHAGSDLREGGLGPRSGKMLTGQRDSRDKKVAGAVGRGWGGRLHGEEVTLSCDVLLRCPALWMTSALSLTTPLSPSPQLCPGPPMFPLPGPTWLLEVPPFPASPGPELRCRLERERAHPHAPPVPWPGAALASGAAQGGPGVLRRRASAREAPRPRPPV